MFSDKAKSTNETNPPEFAHAPELVAGFLIHLADPKKHIQEVRI